MKKVILAAILFATASTFTSCSSDDNSKEIVNTDSKFKGTWTGTYSGNDSGTFTALIDANGAFTGQASSSDAAVVFVIKGNVNDSGELDADFYSNDSPVGEFNGTLTSNSGHGTWTNMIVNFMGTWQATKN